MFVCVCESVFVCVRGLICGHNWAMFKNRKQWEADAQFKIHERANHATPNLFCSRLCFDPGSLLLFCLLLQTDNRSLLLCTLILFQLRKK